MKKLANIISYVNLESKIVVSLDLGLYKPSLKLTMAKNELSKNWILRPGELCVIMAILRAISSFFDGTDLEATLSLLYDDHAVSKILEGKCKGRTAETHITMKLAFFKCYVKEFYELHPKIKERLEPNPNQFNFQFSRRQFSGNNVAHKDAVKKLTDLNVVEKMAAFETKNLRKHQHSELRFSTCTWWTQCLCL